jgi:hypothetical protein
VTKMTKPEDSVHKQRIRLRWIFLLLYLVIGGVLIGNCFLHLGHSPSCEYAYYALLPAGFVIAALWGVITHSGLIPRGPIWTTLEIVFLPIPFLATCAQYYFLGVLLDKLLERWRQRS